MKKIIALAAMLLCCSALAGCGGNTSVSDSVKLTPAEKTQKVLDNVTHPELVEVTGDRLSAYYGIEDGKVTEFSAYICGSGAMPDEFGVFIVADESAAAELAASLNDRVEKQRSTFADYTPDEMYKFDDCFVNTNGTTVSYAVCVDNSFALETFGN